MFKNKRGPHIVLSVCWGPQLGVLTNLVFPIVDRDKDFGGLPGHLPPNNTFSRLIHNAHDSHPD